MSKKTDDFAIDPEIEQLLTPLTAEEYSRLEAQIIDGKHVDPIVVAVVNGTRRILADGHNRRNICIAHGIEIPMREKEFESKELLVQWVIDNQFGRRNLTEERKSYYRGKEYLNAKKLVGRPEEESENNAATVAALNEEHGRTAEKIAKKHGVSERTVHNDAAFAESTDKIKAKKVKEAVLEGESGRTKKEIIGGEKPLICQRCSRVGVRTDCPRCAELRSASAEEKKAARKKPEPQTAPLPAKTAWQLAYDALLAEVELYGLQRGWLGFGGKCGRFDECMEHLTAFWEKFSALQKRMKTDA